MSNTKHTPGPWKITLVTHVNTFIDADDGSPVCQIDMLGRSAKKEEKEANAKLISAAPDMLAALEYIMTWDSFKDHPIAEKAKAAIKKATS